MVGGCDWDFSIKWPRIFFRRISSFTFLLNFLFFVFLFFHSPANTSLSYQCFFTFRFLFPLRYHPYFRVSQSCRPPIIHLCCPVCYHHHPPFPIFFFFFLIFLPLCRQDLPISANMTLSQFYTPIAGGVSYATVFYRDPLLPSPPFVLVYSGVIISRYISMFLNCFRILMTSFFSLLILLFPPLGLWLVKCNLPMGSHSR